MSFFSILWSNYPNDDPCDARNDNGEILFKNQCAIRLSHSLNKSGVSLGAFPLADWLDRRIHPKIKKSVVITGTDWRDSVLDKKGIICFEDYYPASNGSGGDHIDLWDGNSLTGLGSWLRIRFSIVVPGYWSDFRKSKKIRFFEVS